MDDNVRVGSEEGEAAPTGGESRLADGPYRRQTGEEVQSAVLFRKVERIATSLSKFRERHVDKTEERRPLIEESRRHVKVMRFRRTKQFRAVHGTRRTAFPKLDGYIVSNPRFVVNQLHDIATLARIVHRARHKRQLQVGVAETAVDATT